MKTVRRTPKFDRDKWTEARKEMRKKLTALRKNPISDDVDDLPDSVRLDGTTVIFFGVGEKRRKQSAVS